MHIPNRVSGRKYPYFDAVLELIRCWQRGPGLLVGDTNSGRIGIDEEVPAFNLREDQWVAALETAGWRDAFRRQYGDVPAYTWYSPNGRNGFRIDQAFVNRALLPRLIDARYEWAPLEGCDRRDAISDHAALIVDLEV
jgi:exonuclease III